MQKNSRRTPANRGGINRKPQKPDEVIALGQPGKKPSMMLQKSSKIIHQNYKGMDVSILVGVSLAYETSSDTIRIRLGLWY